MHALKGWCSAPWLYREEAKMCSLVSYDSVPRVHSLHNHLQTTQLYLGSFLLAGQLLHY